MQSVYSYFFNGAKQPATKEIDDPIAKFIPEDHQEELSCFVLTNATLFTLKPKKGRQDKECEFMNCSLSLGSQKIELESKQMNIPVIRISNDDYDEDQD